MTIASVEEVLAIQRRKCIYVSCHKCIYVPILSCLFQGKPMPRYGNQSSSDYSKLRYILVTNCSSSYEFSTRFAFFGFASGNISTYLQTAVYSVVCKCLLCTYTGINLKNFFLLSFRNHSVWSELNVNNIYYFRQNQRPENEIERKKERWLTFPGALSRYVYRIVDTTVSSLKSVLLIRIRDPVLYYTWIRDG